MNGSLTERLQVLAAYSWNQTEYIRADTTVRDPITGYAPHNTVRLQATYSIDGAPGKLRVGAGVRGQSSQFVVGQVISYNPDGTLNRDSTALYSFRESGWFVARAFADYAATPRISVQLRLENLFDKKYYQTVGTTGSGNFYGEPRSFMLTVRGAL